MPSKGTGNTIMAGLNCATPSMGIWEILLNGADIVMAIYDSYAKLAMKTLFY